MADPVSFTLCCIFGADKLRNVVKMQYICNSDAKNVKRNEKICKKVLTFGWGFVIIILALSDRAKLIKSH